MIIFSKLKDIREDNDITQVQMSKYLNVKRSTYSQWELGSHIIPLNKLCEFADYFNYSIDYVLGLTKTKSTKILYKGLDLEILGNNIKKLRIKNGLSQEQLANTIGVTQTCIFRYEKALICITLPNLYKISKEFNITMSEICGKTNKI